MNKWSKRIKLYRADTLDQIKNWVNRHQDEYHHQPVLIDTHFKDGFVAYIERKERIYRLVSHVDGTRELTREELFNEFKVDGYKAVSDYSTVLQGEPLVSGFLGPMYDGMKDDKFIIRYETKQAYNLLSL